MYEGGHCVFGQWSLNALQEKSAKVAKELLKPADQRQSLLESPHEHFTKDFIHSFAHFESWYYARYRKKEEAVERRNRKIEQIKNAKGASY
jgi:hypothetical protein